MRARRHELPDNLSNEDVLIGSGAFTDTRAARSFKRDNKVDG